MKINASTDLYKDGGYLQNNKTWHLEDSPYKTGVLIKNIEKQGICFDTCADVGCGAGLICELLAEKYPDKLFSGFEPSPDAQHLIRQRKKLTNLQFFDTNFFNAEEHFDLVICLDVFEHVEDYFGFLRSLKSRGQKFIFNIPLDMNMAKVITSGIQHAREQSGHLHYFNQYSAIETLKDCGYVIRACEISVAFLKVPPRNLRQMVILPIRLCSLILGKRFAAKMFGGVSLVVYAE